MKRLYLLDTLRGLASLSVVVWHYQHFYFKAASGVPADFNRASQPFYDYLSLLYNEGSRAVYVFFTLSGFIFFYQYSESVRNGEVGAREFAVLRFSRLWPLHIATLVFVALLQTISVNLDGEFIVYSCNNWKRFLINVLLVSDWLPAGVRCTPFNGPVWSLSDEIFLYITFVIVVMLTPRRWLATCICFMVGLGSATYLLNGYHLLGEPLLCFFAGGLMWLVWQRVPWHVAAVVSAALFLGCALYYLYWSNTMSEVFNTFVLDLLTYPSLVLFLASLQRWSPAAGRRIRIVGDTTYSTYLLHFPIQLTLLLLIKVGIVTINFSEASVWMAFFASLILFSSISFYFFEMPAQRFFRKKLLIASVAAEQRQNGHK